MNERGVITFAAGVAGAVIGYFTPIGPYGGYLIGTAIGAVIEGAVIDDPKDQVFEQESLADVRISNSALGQVIARVYGVDRVAGKYIWASPKIAVEHRERQPSGDSGSKFKGGGTPDNVTITTTYKQHLACSLCEGPILRLSRIWADETLVFDIAQPSRFILYAADASGNAIETAIFPVDAKGADMIATPMSGVLFTGTESQLPSTFIESFEGTGNVQAYRGVAYVLLKDLDLGPSGRVPNLTFEVVQSNQSVGIPRSIAGHTGGVWTGWETEIAQGMAGYGQGDLIFYNNQVANPDIMQSAGGRGTNWVDVLEFYTLVCNGKDESVFVIDANTGVRIQGPVPLNPTSMPYQGVAKADKYIIEHQQVFAAERRITRNEVIGDDGRNTASYVNDGIVFGSLIQITGSQAGNDGFYTVESVTALQLTVFEALVGNEEAESFTIIVLGHGGEVGLKQSVFGYMPTDNTVTVGAICRTVSEMRLFPVQVGESGLIRLALSAIPSQIKFDFYTHDSANTSYFYVACADSGVVKKVQHTGVSLTLTDTITFTGSPAAEDILVTSTGMVYATESQTNSVWHFTSNADKVQVTSNIGLSPGALAEATDGYIWVSNFGERSVSRIHPTLFTVQKFALSIVPTALTKGNAGTMWVASESESLVIKVDIDGSEDAIIKVPRFPIQLVTDLDGYIWAICDMGKTVALINPLGQRVTLPEVNNGLACVVRNECERVGILSEEIDVSGLDVSPVNMTIGTIASAGMILGQLMTAYQFTGVESGYALKFNFKSDAFVAAFVSRNFLAATAGTEPTQAVIPVVRHDELETPTKVVVTAEARHRNYHSDAQSHKLSSHKEGINNVVQLNLPLVLDRYEMKHVAESVLFELVGQRQSYRISLPPRFMLLEPFDVINLESDLDNVVYQSRMSENSLGNNYDSEITATDYKRHIYAGFRSVPSTSKPAVHIIPELPIIFADFIEPPFIISIEDLLDFPRYFIALYARQGIFSSSGAFESRDNQETYNLVVNSNLPAITGNITGTIPNGVVNMWDDTTTITVTLDNSSHFLNMKSDLEVYNRSNCGLFGKEIIFFGSPSVIAPGQYSITHLLRGRLGTEDQTGIHQANERFVLLDEYTRDTFIARYESVRVNISSFFKTLPLSGSISAAEPTSFAPQGRSIQPWAPLITSITQNGLGDWEIQWLHRSRTHPGMRNNQVFDYDVNDTGIYELNFYIDNVLRKTVTTSAYTDPKSTRVFTYLRSQQFTDNVFLVDMDVELRALSSVIKGIPVRQFQAGLEGAVLWAEYWYDVTMTRTLQTDSNFEGASDLSAWNQYESGTGITLALSSSTPLEGTQSVLVTSTAASRRKCFFPQASIGSPDITIGVYRFLVESHNGAATWRAGVYMMSSQEDITGGTGSCYLVGLEDSASNSRTLGIWKTTAGMTGAGAAIDTVSTARRTNCFSFGERFSVEVELRYSPTVYDGLRIIIRKGALDFTGMVDQVDYTDFTPITSSIGAGFYVENAASTITIKLDKFVTYTGVLEEV